MGEGSDGFMSVTLGCVRADSRMEGLLTLRKLERLNLSGNLIRRIPKGIEELKLLTVLRMNR